VVGTSQAMSHADVTTRHALSLSGLFCTDFYIFAMQLNGKQKIAQMARGGNGRKQVISWMDAPDDVYFRANDTHK